MERKKNGQTIIIPGKSEEVDISRAHGDIGGDIKFELSGDEGYFNQLPDAQDLRNLIDRGGRVFITEADGYLLIDPIEKHPKNSPV